MLKIKNAIRILNLINFNPLDSWVRLVDELVDEVALFKKDDWHDWKVIFDETYKGIHEPFSLS